MDMEFVERFRQVAPSAFPPCWKTLKTRNAAPSPPSKTNLDVLDHEPFPQNLAGLQAKRLLELVDGRHCLLTMCVCVWVGRGDVAVALHVNVLFGDVEWGPRQTEERKHRLHQYPSKRGKSAIGTLYPLLIAGAGHG